jgi:hypothetical protein
MIDKALISLRPNSSWDLNGDEYSGIVWKDETQTQPTLEEVNAEIARLQNEYNSTKYQRLRAKEYPSFTDYLDGIVKSDNAQVQAYIDACLAVKAKYPKGNQ